MTIDRVDIKWLRIPRNRKKLLESLGLPTCGFGPTDLKALKASIKKYGQVTPITIIKRDSKTFWVLDGFKRFRILKTLKKQRVLVTIVDND
jgi:ParB-like chromosome segregation protein Spo0J